MKLEPVIGRHIVRMWYPYAVDVWRTTFAESKRMVAWLENNKVPYIFELNMVDTYLRLQYEEDLIAFKLTFCI
jgi:hypothetical protein